MLNFNSLLSFRNDLFCYNIFLWSYLSYFWYSASLCECFVLLHNKYNAIFQFGRISRDEEVQESLPMEIISLNCYKECIGSINEWRIIMMNHFYRKFSLFKPVFHFNSDWVSIFFLFKISLILYHHNNNVFHCMLSALFC